MKRMLPRTGIISLMLVFSQLIFAQNKTITGTVTDKNGAPLAGISVTAKGSTTGTTTGANGAFSLSVPGTVNTLVLSSVGFETQQVDITGKTSVAVSMVEAATNLNEIVVVGYGTARRKDLTGAVSSVKEKDFNKGIQPAPEQLIQGKVPGVQVLSNSGAPGAGTTVRIRGTNSIRAGNGPLFVIDGVPLSNTNSRPNINFTGDIGGPSPSGNPMNFINPADIATIEVLKDASAAAIYGSRGANGVILITTKKGQSGAPRIDLNVSVGFSTIMKKLEVLTGDEYRTALGQFGFPTTVSTPAVPTANFGSDVDALDAILQTGLTQNYNVGFTSGNENARYRVSLGYLDQEGIIRKTDFKKFTAGLNSSFRLLTSKRLGLDVNILSSQTIEHVAPISNSAGFRGSLIGQALQWNPTKSLYKTPDSLRIEYGSDNINPLAYSEAYFDQPKVTTIIASAAPSYKITNNLEYKMQVSVNYSIGIRKQYTTAFINLAELAINTSTGKGGEANVAQNELLIKQITNTLSYLKDFSNLRLNAVLGHEYLKRTFSGNSDYARTLLVTEKPYYYFMASSDPSTRRTYGFADPTEELQSFFGRAILNYNDRFLLTATVRSDGSSKFGENNKYGVFPSFAAAWIINRESFMSGTSFINDLKLRAGWGVTGNQEFPAGASQRLYALDGGNPANFALTQLPNPDLKWESTTTINVGIDYTLLAGRLYGSIDFFNKDTKDILFPRETADPVPPINPVQWVNLPGHIKNKGVEIAVNGKIIQNTSLTWDLGVNLSFLDNKLTDFGSLQLPIGDINGQGLSGAYSQLLVNDKPINTFYLKKFVGIDKASGLSQYEGGEQKFFLGSPNPDMLLGINTTLAYKKLSLEVNMNGAYGHYIYNNTTNAVLSFNNLGKRNLGKTEYDIAISEGEKPVNPTSASSRYLEKGDYLKLANATLSYNIGSLGKDIRSFSVYVTGQNLFVITDYSGFDPEVNTVKTLNGVPSFGIEYTPYPASRTISFGINIGF